MKNVFLKIQRKAPLQVSFLLFLLGQLVASMTITLTEGVTVLALLLIGAAVLYFLFKNQQFLIALGCVVGGILCVFSKYQFSEPISTTADDRFLIEVIEPPQRPKPNVLRVTIFIQRHFIREKNNFIREIHPLDKKILTCKAVELPWKSSSGMSNHDLYLAELTVRGLRPTRSPVSYEATLRRRGVSAQCKIKNLLLLQKSVNHGWYEETISWLKSQYGFEMEAGLYESLIFGYRNDLSNHLEKHFQKTGLSHLLVFSGAQVALIYGALYLVISSFVSVILYLSRSYRVTPISHVVALLLTTYFVLSIGSDKTTVRALLASIISISALQLERRSSLLWGMLVSSFALSIIYPGSMFEPSMQLTYAALFGIWLGLQTRSFLWGCFYTSCVTSCVSLFWFNAFSITGFIANPIIVPVVSFVTTVCGLPALCLAMCHFPGGMLLFRLILRSLSLLEEIVYRASTLSWSYIEINPALAHMVGSIGLACLIVKGFAFKNRRSVLEAKLLAN